MQLSDIKIVVNGLGAAGTACCHILLAAGARHIFGCGRKGAILRAEGDDLEKARANLLGSIHQDEPFGPLQDVLPEAMLPSAGSAAMVMIAQRDRVKAANFCVETLLDQEQRVMGSALDRIRGGGMDEGKAEERFYG